MPVGFGGVPFGGGPFGGEGGGGGVILPPPELLQSLRMIRRNVIEVTFVGPVKQTDPSAFDDALNPHNYLIARPDGAWAPPVMRVDSIDDHTVQLWCQASLDATIEYSVSLSPEVIEWAVQPLDELSLWVNMRRGIVTHEAHVAPTSSFTNGGTGFTSVSATTVHDDGSVTTSDVVAGGTHRCFVSVVPASTRVLPARLTVRLKSGIGWAVIGCDNFDVLAYIELDDGAVGTTTGIAAISVAPLDADGYWTVTIDFVRLSAGGFVAVGVATADATPSFAQDGTHSVTWRDISLEQIRVSMWRDFSGRGNHLSQSDDTKRPIFDARAPIGIAGGVQTAIRSVSAGFLAALSDPSLYRPKFTLALAWSDSSNPGQLAGISDASYAFRWDTITVTGRVASVDATTSPVAARWHSAVMRYDGARIRVDVDTFGALEVASATPPAASGAFRLFATAGGTVVDAWIREVVYCGTDVGDEAAAAVLAYLGRGNR